MIIIDNILKFRIHVAILFFLIMFNSIRNLSAYTEKDLILVSLSFTSLIMFIYVFNKATDIKEDKISIKHDAAIETYAKYILFIAIIFFLAPIFYLLTNSKLLLLYLFVGFLGFIYSYKVIFFSKRLKEILLIKNLTAAFIWVLPLTFVPIILREYFITFDIQYFLLLFLLFTSLEIIWDIKDIKGDRKYGIKTIPNHIGINKAKILASLLIIFAAMILFFILLPKIIFTLALSTFFLLLLIVIKAQESRSLFYYHCIIFIGLIFWILISFLY